MADFPISGSIDAKAFPFLLTDLHRHGATGSLKVEGPTYQKALYFRGGRILFGSSNDPRDQLGAILIENAKITPDQLEDVNTKVGPGRPLAKVLSETGLVSQQELSEAAQIKVERILWDIITYDAGTFEFEDGVLPKGAVDLKLSTERLILAAVRRVTDQAFVSRHLGSPTVVLRPTAELSARLHEVQSECGGLAEQIDGRQTLQQAAASTRLDPFEAAKVACGLLILGLVQKPESSDGDATFIPTEIDDGQIDLGATARESLDSDPHGETPFFVPEGFEMPAASPPPPAPFAMEAEPEAEPEFAPTIALQAPPIFAEPEPEASPFLDPEPLPFVPEPPPAMARPAVSGSGSSPNLPLIPPPPRDQPIQRMSAPAEIPSIDEEPPAPSVPPSKEDLAALDALLNPRRAAAQTSTSPHERGNAEWEPRFNPSLAGGGRRPQSEGGAMKLVMMVGAVLAVVAVAGGGWYYFNQPAPTRASQASRKVTAPPPARSAATAAVTSEPTEQPTVAVSKSAPTSPPTSAPPATRLPTQEPERTAPPASGGSGDLAGARSLMRGGRFREAADGFQAHLRRSAGLQTIQLLVACSDETVKKAADSVAQDELFIVPVNYKGRSCYRMGWGLYDNEPQATQALRSIPEYFRQPGVTPRVVATSAFLD